LYCSYKSFFFPEIYKLNREFVRLESTIKLPRNF
jgi:hypothetical protein